MLKNLFVFSLLGGAGQLVTYFSLIIFSELLSKENFGNYAYLLSIIMIISSVIGCRYEISVIKHGRQNANYKMLPLYISPLVIALSGSILLIFRSILNVDLSDIAVVLVSALGFYLHVWLYSISIVSDEIRSARVAVFLKPVFAAIGQYFSIIYFENIWIGLVAGLYIALIPYRKVVRKLLFPKVKVVCGIIFEQKDVFLFSLPTTILAAVNVQALTIFFGVAYGMESAGYYFLANKLLEAPLRIIQQHLGPMLGRDFCKSQDKISFFIKSALVVFIAVIIYAIFAYIFLTKLPLNKVYPSLENIEPYFIPVLLITIFRFSVSPLVGLLHYDLGSSALRNGITIFFGTIVSLCLSWVGVRDPVQMIWIYTAVIGVSYSIVFGVSMKKVINYYSVNN
ncbi:hypothetical protein IB286_13985 [Spongiibacter sp. KMU-158]|uniref:Uncharacterized protein n=1 Tax=Spongiibacter pelagi TaxID=2760804 RepID=A0A927C3G8_9GAMM|nr:hypothetical protein [Spongiibacter pelagi]MBD2860109.1 hypothetical protein [Spongiibacter pelagi]